ncbi:MAG: hypothetical protein QNJ13_05515 [Paracoccaceae bacterium]|nr:hypothetical protein [Paracoccaceae bacterium]
MSGSVGLPVILLSGAIVVVLVIRAALVIRHEGERSRGSLPGKGHHVIDANYNSGLGGQTGQFRVPKDPDEYAKSFVPRSRR